MKPTLNRFSRTDRLKITGVIIALGILLLLLGFLVGLLLRGAPLPFARSARLAQSTPTHLIPVTAPSSVPQSADCRPSTLVLGTTTFQIQDLARGADGSLAIPGDTIGIAYRLAGTEPSPVFVLSPMPQNITVMSTISIGSAARLTGPGCSTETYSLSAAQAGALDGSVFAAQPEAQITVFFPTVDSGAGFVFKGRPVTESVAALGQPTAVGENALPPAAESTILPPTVAATKKSSSSPTAETIVPTPTSAIPTPDYSEILAEIGLQDTSLSLFRTSLKIEVSIYNFGKIPISLSERDVALTQPDGTSLALKSSNPDFPAEIQPGETKTVELNFDSPSSPTVTLRVLTVEYDIDGY